MDVTVKKQIDKQTKKFIKNVKAFLAARQADKKIPSEWECSLMMLEDYYRQYCILTKEIENLDGNLVIEGRYGPQPNPLLACRDRICCRLESHLSSLGLNLKAASKLHIATVVEKEQSVLDKFMKSKMEKKIETR